MKTPILMITTIAAGLMAVGTAASAQETTYTFTGGLYTSVNNATNCTVGECATYTTSQRAIVTLTFAAPLAPNLSRADRSASVTAYTVSDGVRTTSGPGPNAALFDVGIATGADGLPSDYFVLLERTPGPPYLANNPADPNSRFSYVTISPAGNNVVGNAICGRRGSGTASVSGPGVCNSDPRDASTSTSGSGQATVVTSAATVPPAPIPTMTEWAMILLGLMLAGGAAVHLTRRRVV